MNSLQQRLSICSLDERAEYRSRQISHFISISNPGAETSKPTWFEGAHLQLWFGDVVSEADAKRCKTIAPSIEDVKRAVGFFREAWAAEHSRVLVSCDQGASRSPALAYIFVADQYGAGREDEAFSLVLNICPVAVPNGLVVRLGDNFLGRGGALIAPLKEFHTKLNAELFPKTG